ncbi:hypothetical protein [Flavobacterium sp. DSR2-3-3]|uniref:hypothetical protein n=1 Tax=Flavobacterium sp. DSR2-3-3 TaxID=2804632 RepID=UPI003CE7F96E
MEKAAHGNHVLVFTEQHLNENTVLQKLSICGVKHIGLRAIQSDFIDIPRAKAMAMRVANVSMYSPYSAAEQAVVFVLALNKKFILG